MNRLPPGQRGAGAGTPRALSPAPRRGLVLAWVPACQPDDRIQAGDQVVAIRAAEPLRDAERGVIIPPATLQQHLVAGSTGSQLASTQPTAPAMT